MRAQLIKIYSGYFLKNKAALVFNMEMRMYISLQTCVLNIQGLNSYCIDLLSVFL